MKLSKTAQWIIVIGVSAILIITAGVFYGRQMTEQRMLRTEIAQAQQDFTKYSNMKKDLEIRLRQAESSIASVQSEFQQYTESIEINEALYEAADDYNVTITKLRSSIPDVEMLNGINYNVFSLDISARGEVVPALLNFTNRVSEIFSASTITSVGINVPVEEDGVLGESTLSLKIDIYAY